MLAILHLDPMLRPASLIRSPRRRAPRRKFRASDLPPNSITVYTDCKMRQSPNSNGRELGWGSIMRTVLVTGLVGFLLSTALGGLLESAYAQSAKAKSKPQATGQMICNSGGCRPVKPGCKIDSGKNVGQIEVCNGATSLNKPGW